MAETIDPAIGPMDGVGLKKYLSSLINLDPRSNLSYGVGDPSIPAKHLEDSLQKGLIILFASLVFWFHSYSHHEHPMTQIR
jgi:hypothetical protein